MTVKEALRHLAEINAAGGGDLPLRIPMKREGEDVSREVAQLSLGIGPLHGMVLAVTTQEIDLRVPYRPKQRRKKP